MHKPVIVLVGRLMWARARFNRLVGGASRDNR